MTSPAPSPLTLQQGFRLLQQQLCAEIVAPYSIERATLLAVARAVEIVADELERGAVQTGELVDASHIPPMAKLKEWGKQVGAPQPASGEGQRDEARAQRDLNGQRCRACKNETLKLWLRKKRAAEKTVIMDRGFK